MVLSASVALVKVGRLGRHTSEVFGADGLSAHHHRIGK